MGGYIEKSDSLAVGDLQKWRCVTTPRAMSHGPKAVATINSNSTCPHCGAQVPEVAMTAAIWKAVIAALKNGSSTLAAAEISSLGLAAPAQSDKFIDHVLACVYSWPFEGELLSVLHRIDRAFEIVPRPDHFTDSTHCSECAEHDELLLNKTAKTITRGDLGNQGWDPINFASDQGWAYYFPALARFAVTPTIWRACDPYVVLLASHLSWHGPDNSRLKYCTPEQRSAVAALVDWIARNEEEIDCLSFDSSDFFHATWQSWRDGAEIWQNAAGRA
jgi:hypothetical protein